MATMSELVNDLIHSPSLYTLDESDLRLVENPGYTGIYFSLTREEGQRLHCHMTIGKWSEPRANMLIDKKQRRLLQLYKDSVKLALCSKLRCFADTDAIHLDGRVIATVDVQSTLHCTMYNLRRNVMQETHTSERGHRKNFHISVDSVS